MEKIKKLASIIDNSNNIVFFGGAGVSTESGIKDFRGENGLYKSDKPVEYYLSRDCFYNEPKVFFDFYKKNMNFLKICPNITHKYLANLEKSSKLKAIITQNIDGLHQKAGSQNVLEIHGTIYKNHCIKCHKEYSALDVIKAKGIPKCICGGIIKPDVVLYGEMLPDCFDLAINYIKKCDTLIVAGTSLRVFPASNLINYFNGKNLIIINKEATPYDIYANIVIHDNLKNVISKLKI